MKWMMNLFKSKNQKQLESLKESFLLGKLSAKEYKEKVYMIDPSEWDRIATPEDKEMLHINESYNCNLISKEEYKEKIKNLDKDKWILLLDDDERYVYDLEVKLKEGKITQETYKKEILTIEKKPYISILNIEFDDEQSQYMFEFDWNEYFINELKDNGFKGVTDEDLVNEWFTAFSAMVASESDKVILTDPEDIRRVTKRKNKTEHF